MSIYLGMRCGLLTIAEPVEDSDHKFKCVCQCGGEKVAYIRSLLLGRVKSCGCLRRVHVDTANRHKTLEQRRRMYAERATTHGQGTSGSVTKAYRAWTRMKQKCYNDKTSGYKFYGALGIQVCDRWKNSFENFYEDMGDAPDGRYALVRINKSYDYSPDNCKWEKR